MKKEALYTVEYWLGAELEVAQFSSWYSAFHFAKAASTHDEAWVEAPHGLVAKFARNELTSEYKHVTETYL